MTQVGRGWVRVAGAVDVSNAALLAQALEQAASTGLDDVHVDARELEFMDLFGLRALVKAAVAIGPGRRLHLHHPQLQVRRLFELVGHLADVVEVDAPVVLPDQRRGRSDQPGTSRGGDGGRDRCIACGRPIRDPRHAVRIHGAMAHRDCALYRRRR